MLASQHNVHFYQQLVRDARRAILSGAFEDFRRGFLAEYRSDLRAPEAVRSA